LTLPWCDLGGANLSDRWDSGEDDYQRSCCHNYCDRSPHGINKMGRFWRLLPELAQMDGKNSGGKDGVVFARVTHRNKKLCV